MYVEEQCRHAPDLKHLGCAEAHGIGPGRVLCTIMVRTAVQAGMARGASSTCGSAASRWAERNPGEHPKRPGVCVSIGVLIL